MPTVPGDIKQTSGQTPEYEEVSIDEITPKNEQELEVAERAQIETNDIEYEEVTIEDIPTQVTDAIELEPKKEDETEYEEIKYPNAQLEIAPREDFESEEVISELRRTGDTLKALQISNGDIAFALETTMGIDPATSQEVKRLAKESQLPGNLVLDNLKVMKEKSLASKIFETLTRVEDDGSYKYKGIANWVVNPSNMATAKHDIERLTIIEDLTRAFNQNDDADITKVVKSATAAGLDFFVGNALKIPDALLATLWAPHNLRAYFTNKVSDSKVPFGQFNQTASGKFGDQVSRYADSIKPVEAGEDFIQHIQDGNYKKAAFTLTLKVAEQIPNIALFSGALAAKISQTAVLSGIGLLETSGSLEEGRKKGKEPIPNLIASVTKGIAEYGFEKITYGILESLGKGLVKSIGKDGAKAVIKEMSAILFKNSMKEGLSEGGTQITQDLADWATGDKLTLEQATRNFITASTVGSLAGSGITSIATTSQAIANQREYVAHRKHMDQLMEEVDKLTMDSDSKKSVLDSIDDANGIAENKVFIQTSDFVEFFQDNKEGYDKAVKELGLSNQISENGAVDVVLEIDKNRMASTQSGADLYEAVQDRVHFSPEGITGEEHQQLLEGTRELVQEVEESEKADIATTLAQEAPIQLVKMREALLRSKKEGGFGFTAEKVDADIAIFSAGIEQFSRKRGETVQESLDRINPIVETMSAVEGPKGARGGIQFKNGATIINLYKNADGSSLVHEAGHLFMSEAKQIIDMGLATEQAIKDYKTLSDFAGDINSAEGQETIAKSFEKYLATGKAPSIKLVDAFRSVKEWMMKVYKSLKGMNAPLSSEVSAVFDRMLATDKEVLDAQVYYGQMYDLEALIPEDKKSNKAIKESRKSATDRAREKQLSVKMKAFLKSQGGKKALQERAKREVEDTKEFLVLDDGKNFGSITESDVLEYAYEETIRNIKSNHRGFIKKDSKPKPRASTYYTLVVKAGGLNPKTLDVTEKQVIEENNLRNIFNKDGHSLDTLSATLMDEGTLKVPENRNPSDFLYNLIIDSKANAENNFERLSTVEVTLESLTEAYGYSDPGALLAAIEVTPKKSVAIKTRTDDLLSLAEADLLKDIKDNENLKGEKAVHTDKTLTTLMAELQLFSNKAARVGKAPSKARVSRNAVKDAAINILDQKSIQKASRYDLFLKADQKFADLSYDLAKKGNFDQAYDAKLKQIMNHALAVESIKVKEFKRKLEDSYKTKKISPKLAKTSIVYRDLATKVIRSYGLNKGATLEIKNDTQVPNFNSEVLDVNMLDLIPEWIKDNSRLVEIDNWKELTVSETKQLNDAIKAVISTGRDKLLSIDEVKYASRADIKKEMLESIKKLPTKTLADVGSAARRRDDIASFLKSKGNKIEFVFNRYDNYIFDKTGRLGAFGKLFYDQVDSFTNHKELVDDVNAKTLPFWKKFKKFGDRITKEKNSKGFKLAWWPTTTAEEKAGIRNRTPEMIFTTLLNTGSESNLSAIMNGNEISMNQIQKMASLLEEDELLALQGIWDETNKLAPMIDKVNLSAYNNKMTRVLPSKITFTAKNGVEVTLEGGYYPLAYDRRLSSKVGNLKDARTELTADMVQDRINNVQQKTPKSGFLNDRKLNHKLPVLLKSNVWFTHVVDSSRYISYTESSADLFALLQDKEVKEEILRVDTELMYKETINWAAHLANPQRDPKSDLITQFFNAQRRMSTIGILGLNIKVATKQKLSMINAWNEIGSRALIEGIWKTGVIATALGGVTESNKTYQTMIELDPRMRSRVGSFDRELRDIKTSFNPNKKVWTMYGQSFSMADLADISMFMIRMADRVAVSAVWYGSYNKFLRENTNLPHDQRQKEAVIFAGSMVARTQPMATPTDLNALQRDERLLIKMASPFMTWSFTAGNRMGSKYRALKDGAITPAQYVKHNMVEIVGVSVAMATITSLMIDGEPPDKKDLIGTIVGTILAPIPIVRDIPGALIYNRGIGDFTAFEGINRAVKAISSISDSSGLSKGLGLREEHLTDKEWGKTVMDIGRLGEIITGFPISNFYKDTTRMHDNIMRNIK